jgi:hypothetical protein
MLTELHGEVSLPPWLTGDEVYGQNPTLRDWCEHADHRIGYVLGIPRSFAVTLGCGTRMRADQVAELVAADGWNHRSAGPGSKGDRDIRQAVATRAAGTTRWQCATARPRHPTGVVMFS